MPGDLTFVDTNVLLYAYDRDAGDKRSRAAATLRELWQDRRGVISTQVLQEFYVNARRKLATPLSRAEAERVLRRYEAWPVAVVEPADVFEAIRIEVRHQLAFWDALIVGAAARLGATVLLSEDLNAGQVIEGVRVLNPFEG